MELPPIIMTAEEIEQTEEECTDRLRDHLTELERKPERHSKQARVEPRTLRTKEAARYIGVSDWKMRELVYSGQIECVKQKYFLFAVDDLDRWIKQNREKEVL